MEEHNMSADNGIYILKTKDQYRVIEAQAIENLWWSFIKWDFDKGMVPTRIVEYYGGTRYTRNQETAYRVADAMANKCYILEYGIRTFSINKTWKQIIAEAKKLAPLEIEAIKKKNDGRWDYDLKWLEKIIAM
jgi:hypothetical protein